MKGLEDELKDQLVERLGLTKDSWELAMAEPVAEKRGKVINPRRVAEQIVENVLTAMPPEITSKGSKVVKVYFTAFNYDAKKQFLMQAMEAERKQK